MREFEVVDLILRIESDCDGKASQRGFIRRQWTSMICGSPQGLIDAAPVHQTGQGKVVNAKSVILRRRHTGAGWGVG
jgi:hypothetical protein